MCTAASNASASYQLGLKQKGVEDYLLFIAQLKFVYAPDMVHVREYQHKLHVFTSMFR